MPGMRDFYRRLAETPRRWQLRYDIAIRTCGLEVQCPITAVAGTPCTLVNDDVQAKAGLTCRQAERIMNAADGYPSCHPGIRRKLLKACGLQEHQ